MVDTCAAGLDQSIYMDYSLLTVDVLICTNLQHSNLRKLYVVSHHMYLPTGHTELS